jgi:hypothetical protein
MNWRGQPPTSRQVVVQSLSATTSAGSASTPNPTTTSHHKAVTTAESRDDSCQETGTLVEHELHGERSYRLKPATRRTSTWESTIDEPSADHPQGAA